MGLLSYGVTNRGKEQVVACSSLREELMPHKKQVGPTKELPHDADVVLDVMGQIALPV